MERHDNSKYWEGSFGKAAEGLSPHQVELRRGTVLYRFIDISRLPAAMAADGPWWFEYEHFQSIKHFAERHGHPLGYAARLFAAILYEWSEVNAVVRAEVTASSLLAWKGRGKQVEASGRDARDVESLHGLLTEKVPRPSRRMTPMQGVLEVYQLYIPGLGKPHHQFHAFMRLKGSEQIPTG